jgi:hypothetical protein
MQNGAICIRLRSLLVSARQLEVSITHASRSAYGLPAAAVATARCSPMPQATYVDY